MTARDVVMRSLICDAPCPAVFGPVDLPNLRRVRLEAKRAGWRLRFILYHGALRQVDLCPEHAGISEVI